MKKSRRPSKRVWQVTAVLKNGRRSTVRGVPLRMAMNWARMVRKVTHQIVTVERQP